MKNITEICEPSIPFLCNLVREPIIVKSNNELDPRHFMLTKLNAKSNAILSDIIIIIFTRRNDPETNLVCAKLLERGIDYVRLNVEDLLQGIEIAGNIDKNTVSPKIMIKSNKMEVDASNIRVGWIRHFDYQSVDFGSDDLIGPFIFQQWSTAFDSIQNLLPCKWVNSPESLKQSFNRLKQLQLAKEQGFLIPGTIVTNSPTKAVEFVNSNQNDTIIKPLVHHRIESKSKLYNLYTHPITSDDILKFKDLSPAPCILQQRIHKGSELRITVVDDKVFASEILPSDLENDYIDIHKFSLNGLTKNSVSINNELEKKCVGLIRSMNLQFGAIDLVKDIDNKFYFLEVNALGDWLWTEQSLKLPITESVTNLIERMAK